MVSGVNLKSKKRIFPTSASLMGLQLLMKQVEIINAAKLSLVSSLKSSQTYEQLKQARFFRKDVSPEVSVIMRITQSQVAKTRPIYGFRATSTTFDQLVLAGS